ncbi:hypothetical protein BDK51DRAFT_46151 [Blyttiomyces helicus]|uniref:B9 domain-containing protein 1 n=1 Tax=Blyttiomyces helicus TaxID=388810 RepID=A0A4P9W2G3_9FUNG|nr:hypothetical protein BDK51DRAFT_46151 [Blyttiomyces helicus]|eukprot:RKO85922.1 hypothetical protein BDK51DRAFT_46151 [Blyttiomyces helicus]
MSTSRSSSTASSNPPTQVHPFAAIGRPTSWHLRANNANPSLPPLKSSRTFEEEMYCKFSFLYGPDWTIVSDLEEGITQLARAAPTTVFRAGATGRPQLIVSIYGPDLLGRDVVKGYGSVRIPLSPGRPLAVLCIRPAERPPVMGGRRAARVP